MEAKEVNNKKDGWYDKSQTRSLVGFKCIVVLLFLSAITPAYGQYLSDKGVYQQQPMLVQPIRCDCPTFGLADAFAHARNFLLLLISFFYQYRSAKQNRDGNNNNARQDPIAPPQNALIYHQLPALMPKNTNPFVP
ncbi:unnamed protein product [Cylicocyclus nassatus]|uniref:Uncharacterized protein n=1 Tax=Cylicocyclus nassatus TaxID=53992 RepID=A0AA36HBX9_CYLNA|nr:unnamed protein product [Cylicocyclus nassatus]